MQVDQNSGAVGVGKIRMTAGPSADAQAVATRAADHGRHVARGAGEGDEQRRGA